MGKGLKIAVIGGGSSYTPELLEGFIKRADVLPVVELYLVDIEAGKAKLDIIADLSRRMISRAGLETKVTATLDRRAAIKDADFIVTQIRVGGLAARITDERIPLKYNSIGQETNGAGGFAKALRTVPVILDICRDIEELAPEAWLINFTNPSGVVTEAVSKYTRVKVMGLCNVPIGMVNNVAKMLEVESRRVRMDFIGLNHMVFARNIYLDGANITSRVLDMLGDSNSITMNNIPDLKWNSDFVKALKMLPCPYHRYYYMTDEMLEEEKKAAEKVGTRGEQVKRIEDELFELYKNPELDTKPKVLEQRGGAFYSDAAVSLISSIYNDSGNVHTVNIRNNGAVSNLPDDVIVEINAIINRDGARALSAGRLPDAINGLVQAIKSYELLTIEACVSGNYHSALVALTAHPLITSVEAAGKILKEILDVNKRYLPLFNQQ